MEQPWAKTERRAQLRETFSQRAEGTRRGLTSRGGTAALSQVSADQRKRPSTTPTLAHRDPLLSRTARCSTTSRPRLGHVHGPLARERRHARRRLRAPSRLLTDRQVPHKLDSTRPYCRLCHVEEAPTCTYCLGSRVSPLRRLTIDKAREIATGGAGYVGRGGARAAPRVSCSHRVSVRLGRAGRDALAARHAQDRGARARQQADQLRPLGQLRRGGPRQVQVAALAVPSALR